MGIDLNGAAGRERFSFGAWADVQVLALVHGWEPEGTYCDWEDPPRWLGYFYNANSGQSVRPADAINLASALSRALHSLVDSHEEADRLDLDVLPPVCVFGKVERPDDATLRSPFIRFSGPWGRERIESFIDYCKSGGFSIS